MIWLVLWFALLPLGLALLAWGRPRWVRVRRWQVQVGVRRLLGFRRTEDGRTEAGIVQLGEHGTGAQTWLFLVLYRYERPEDIPERLVHHEGAHVAQWLLLGPVFWLSYLTWLAIQMPRFYRRARGEGRSWRDALAYAARISYEGTPWECHARWVARIEKVDV